MVKFSYYADLTSEKAEEVLDKLVAVLEALDLDPTTLTVENGDLEVATADEVVEDGQEV